MARPRSFDRGDALTAAMRTFWTHGYEATSLTHLIDATGVCKASLYSTFGSKDDLYQECLARYRSSETARLAELLDADRLTDALTSLFDLLAERSRDDVGGCFVVNAAMERAVDSPATANQVSEQLADLNRLLRARLDRAVDDGELDASADTTSLADYVVTSIQGLRVVGKIHRDHERIRTVARLICDAVVGRPSIRS